jgi:hypothetical protein
VAALAAFNDNFFVRVFATHDKQIMDALVDVHDKPPVPVGAFPPYRKFGKCRDYPGEPSELISRVRHASDSQRRSAETTSAPFVL